MIKIILGVLLAIIAIALAIMFILYNRKRMHITRCAKAASDDQLETIYALIEQSSTEPPTCAVFARTNRTPPPGQDDRILIPAYIETWGGRVITSLLGKDVQFRFSEFAATETALRGKSYRMVSVPRRTTKSGKTRNQFSPERYLSRNPQLLSALQAVCPAYPAELLPYLLATGAEGFEFDDINQARLGGSPCWVQDPEFPNCDHCKKRMTMILQLPGTMLPEKPLPRGTFYFFGCPKHPDQTKTVAQFT